MADREPPRQERRAGFDDHTRLILLEDDLDRRDAYEADHAEVHKKLNERDQWFYRGAALALILFAANLALLLVNR